MMLRLAPAHEAYDAPTTVFSTFRRFRMPSEASDTRQSHKTAWIPCDRKGSERLDISRMSHRTGAALVRAKTR